MAVASSGRDTGSYGLTVSDGGPVTPEDPTADVAFNDQPSDGGQVVVNGTLLSECGFLVVSDESGQVLGVSEYFDAGSHEDVAVGLDPDLDRSATLTATAYTDGDGTFDAAADTPSLFEGTPVSDDARITVETPPPEPTYYQVDFVAGTDRRTRRERAVRRAEPADAVRVRYHDAGTTGKDTARPSQRVRTRLDYGHIRADDATATVEFTVNESCPTRRSRWRSTRCPARRSTRVPTSRNR